MGISPAVGQDRGTASPQAWSMARIATDATPGCCELGPAEHNTARSAGPVCVTSELY
jgi:glycogen debranching enzyme